jgi:hypothetical protein
VASAVSQPASLPPSSLLVLHVVVVVIQQRRRRRGSIHPQWPTPVVPTFPAVSVVSLPVTGFARWLRERARRSTPWIGNGQSRHRPGSSCSFDQVLFPVRPAQRTSSDGRRTRRSSNRRRPPPPNARLPTHKHPVVRRHMLRSIL